MWSRFYVNAISPAGGRLVRGSLQKLTLSYLEVNVNGTMFDTVIQSSASLRLQGGTK